MDMPSPFNKDKGTPTITKESEPIDSDDFPWYLEKTIDI
jgi:hypothetical protein